MGNSTMSETEATAAPTAEEIKGTKRAAEDDVDLAKKQKTENGANGNGAAVAAENGAEVEEEEDVDEEDEEALGEEEEGEGEEDLEKIQILRKKRFAKCQTNPKYDSKHQVIKFEKQLKRDGVFLSKKQK